ncbi:uncharacterized protein [Antedon mediterranea]|uniref:uncharacterized protein n=1 Tax=Antedon mediterranea TaxID=105859 RepID=UPI003AF4CF55
MLIDNTNFTSCGENEYQCTDDGRCLPSAQVCDHILDCKDGQDEGNCVTCGDATVVQISRHCDGNYDCSDERDERNCETPGCHVITYESNVECNLADATFSTFNYPFDYSPGSRCTWYIESPSSSSFIRLTFLDFDIPSDALCQSDTIIVYDGEVESDDIIGEFCNYNRPPEYVISSRTKMSLVFYSDSTVSGHGFQASYTSESIVSDGADFNSNKCSPEWIFYGNACYRNFSNMQYITWTDAKWECEQMNAHLVFVSTELEMEFIHYMLTHFWNSEHTEVYIGLSDRLSSNGLLSWSNGSPMSYTAWYMQDGKENVAKNQPKAGDLEQCTLIRLDNFHSLEQWNEVACEFPTTSQYICKYQLDMYLNVTTTVEQVEKSFKGCYREDYQCNNQECIHQLFVCDGKTDCRDGSDEFNCESECEYGDFQCKDKQCIPVSFVCDFIPQCIDMSDEIECYYPNCTSEEFTCDNGQCIDSNQHCDLLIQCTDGSDEKDCDFCSSGFQCYDGSCLPLRAVCDATNDCPGDTVEDEINCDYWINATCPADTMVCKNKECSPKRFRCLYDLDEYHIQKGCRDMSHLEQCDDYNCLEDTFKCPSSYCIAERLRCNAVWDCPNGEDERECDSYVCPNSYKCRNSIICIAHNDRCNGVKNCPEGDDELFCDDGCPAPECSCRGLEVACHGIAWNETLASIILSSARYLNLTNLSRNSVNRRSTRGVTLKDSLLLDIDQFSLLIKADFSSNGIEEILPNTFGQQVNLQILVLSNNEIKHLEKGAFNGLSNLQFLYIDYNGLISVDSGVFSVLSVLQNLYLQENMLTEFQEDVFDGLYELKSLSTDDFLFCCMINDIVGDIEHCHPPADQFSSCEDLMKNEFLRVLMWILGVSALLGNVIVIVWRLYSKDYRNVQSILITNLATSDFLMGLYMIIIAGADLYYRGRYARVAEDWKSSFLCNFAGAISTLSSEFSVFILVVMSVDRAVSVGFPFSTARLNRKKCLIMLAIAWLTMIVISFLPMFNIPYFGESYYGRPSVCLALPLTGDRLDGWEYSVAIFLGFNLLGFVIIAVSYTYIYVVVKQAGASVNKSQSKTKEFKMATKMAIIVFTDFCCWFPIILMGIVSQAGAWQIPVEIYVWSATLIMPINSSLNPYLYTIPYIKDARKRKKLAKKGTCASIMMSETQKTEVTLLDKVKQDLERNRVLPLLSLATSRPYLLSSILATHTKKVTENLTTGPLFTNEEITQIETDLTKALQFLHRSKFTHGTISEEHVIIQTDKANKRAFLIVASTSTTNTTEGVSPEQDFEQLNNLVDKLRRSKIN